MDIEPAEALASVQMETFPENTFVEKFCVPLLRNAQNSDGGWGFHSEAQSRVEPTCWAVKALASRAAARNTRNIARGLDFLLAAQLADGSWPSTPEEKTGCWVTSLVCWVFSGTGDTRYSKAIAGGLSWICEDWPRDSSWLQRWVTEIFFGKPAYQTESRAAWLGMDAAHQQLGGADGFRPAGAGESGGRRTRQLGGEAQETSAKPCFTTACARAADGIAVIRKFTAWLASRWSFRLPGLCSLCGVIRSDAKIWRAWHGWREI